MTLSYDSEIARLEHTVKRASPANSQNNAEWQALESALQAFVGRYNQSRRDPFELLAELCVERILNFAEASALCASRCVSRAWLRKVAAFLREKLDRSDDPQVAWERVLHSQSLSGLNALLSSMIRGSCHKYVSLDRLESAPFLDLHLQRELVRWHFSHTQRNFRLTIWLRYRKSRGGDTAPSPPSCAHNYAYEHFDAHAASYLFDRGHPLPMVNTNGENYVERTVTPEMRASLDEHQSFSLLLSINTAKRKLLSKPTVLDWSTELCIDESCMETLAAAIQALFKDGFWRLERNV